MLALGPMFGIRVRVNPGAGAGDRERASWQGCCGEDFHLKGVATHRSPRARSITRDDRKASGAAERDACTLAANAGPEGVASRWGGGACDYL